MWSQLSAGINTIDAASGDTVNVDDLPAGVYLSVDSGGQDTVNIAPGGDFTRIRGVINVSNTAPQGIALSVNDSADAAAVGRTVTLNTDSRNGGGSVLFSGLGTVSFGFHALSALVVSGDGGGNNFDILNTDQYFTTTLNTGAGSDKHRELNNFANRWHRW